MRVSFHDLAWLDAMQSFKDQADEAILSRLIPEDREMVEALRVDLRTSTGERTPSIDWHNDVRPLAVPSLCSQWERHATIGFAVVSFPGLNHDALHPSK